VVPGGNFNDVMYEDGKLGAVIHINMTNITKKDLQYFQDFQDLAWEDRGSKNLNYGYIHSGFFFKMSNQVGLYRKNLPQLVVFNGKQLTYFSDRKLPRNKKSLKTFMDKTIFGDAHPKKPGSETEEKEAPPPKPLGNESLSSNIPSKLYGKYAKHVHGEGHRKKTTEDRLTRTEEIMEQLLMQQKMINAAVIRLHEELFDLRYMYPPPQLPPTHTLLFISSIG